MTLSLAACGGSDGGGAAEDEAAEEAVDRSQPGVYELAPDHYEAVIFAFEGGFQPTEIRVPVGATVDFRARTTDILHGFLIEGTDVELELDIGQVAEASYTFEEPGEYDFVCHIYCSGGHLNMMGVVIVE